MSSARPRPRLNAEAILAAAVALIDTDGIAGLTMRRLGDALEVEAMALYRYFPSRRALLDAVVDNAVLRTAADPGMQWADDDDWSDYLHRLAHGFRQMALTHPRLFPLVATHPADVPWIRPPLRSLRWIDSFLAGLMDHDFPPDAAVSVYRQFSTFLLGHLLLEVSTLGLEHRDSHTAVSARPDDDRRAAAEQRHRDALAGDAAAPAGPTAAEIEAGSLSPITCAAEEPVVIASGLEVTADAARAQAAEDRGDPPGATDRAERQTVGDMRVDGLDEPIAAAVVSTATVDLTDYPYLASLADLLARDTALTDFDQHLDALIAGLATLRRP